ncbi:beta-ketoacyl-ACP synthase III [Alkaliphilus hydrothermalis]|uniref:Beta-ketoacyl-[acyl-carrier-protein] synthase III n=1 Tax=Alkaliphilus hydrothermalis TaxID=1482730 RepID=A0ABS2NL02_9FIRM|nr:beta-ketoacyl-ACP synthase III [Alkaliphilus hydrothermalis]MBM7613621.1 3-oxoacyl-[acyl-carrier-protein] synthase-3 [Alkaliphilus hydrothermalis]
MIKQYSVGIGGTGSALPEKEITNLDLEKMVDTTDEWIRTRTGIGSRRVADENTATSDLSTEAARKALADADLNPEDVDLIIVATVTPDMAFPSTACIVQKNIGATKAAAFDLEAACSGFIYGMTIAEQFIKNGVYKNALVIGAETLSKILNWEDRNTCVLFGDGAGAVVLQRTEEGMGILSSYLGADGASGDVLTQPAGGSRIPASEFSLENKLHYVQMDGSEVFKFAVRVMGRAAKEALSRAGYDLEDIDFLIPHQANIRIIEGSAKRLKLPMDKVYVNLDKYGNMSAASVPVALDEAVRNGKIKKNDLVVLVAFGGGLTWGSTLLKWSK